jgi:hypothetical protein
VSASLEPFVLARQVHAYPTVEVGQRGLLTYLIMNRRLFWRARWAALVGVLFTAAALPAGAQHEGHTMGGAAMTAGPLGISMDRMGSGTTWIPDAVSLPSRHITKAGWELMLHGFGFLQYDKQGGPRGADQFGSLNWAMLMASRPMAGGRLTTRAMLSLDPATVTNRGYPLLLQSGETYNGAPIVDRQHPHDFLMEVAAVYERELTDRLAVSIYAAPSGEPALGPVAFMHRPSAMDDLSAPLTHHWHDATHISFGVVTAGVFGRRWKLEGSAFNGREPDEKRWNLDPIKLDSYAGRLTLNPDSAWSLSAGYGYLRSPEALHPDISIHRLTAAVLHGRKLGANGQWATSLVWGANKELGSEEMRHAALIESEAILDAKNTVFGRVEMAQKTGHDLQLPEPQFNDDARVNVGALSLGYIREVGRWSGATVGLGLRGTVSVVPSNVESIYGSRTPKGGFIFVRIRPVHQAMSSMGGMKMGGNH